MTTDDRAGQPEPPPEWAVPDNSVQLSLAVPGFLPGPLLEVGAGVSVLTGINNVGKSRLLRTLHDLRAVDQPYTLDDLHLVVRTGNETAVLRVRPSAAGEVARWTVTESEAVVSDDVVMRTGSQFDRGSRLPAFASGPRHGFTGPGFPSLAWITGGHPGPLARLRALTMVGAQRVVPDIANPHRAGEVAQDGANLGQVLYTQLNDRTKAFDELERIMRSLFPEIGGVLTVPGPAGNQVRLTLRDRFASRDVPLSECGTGVSQMLYFVAIVLMAPPGRIFLVDEPHVYLHAQAERALADFLRKHPEHSYVVATHSPVFIDAIDPDRLWHLTRDEHGTAAREILRQDPGPRRDLFRALGWQPSQFAWADRVLFVEGDSDAQVYPIWFERWGWSPEVVRCPVVEMGGSGAQSVAQRLAGRLSQWVSLEARVLLDGDQRGSALDLSCLYLPASDLEAVLLRDLEAVRNVLLEGRTQRTGESLASLQAEWPVPRLEQLLREWDGPAVKGSQQMNRLAQEMGVPFKKTVHGPLIAQQMALDKLDDIRDMLKPFVTGQTDGAG